VTEIKAGEVADATAPALVTWAIAYVTPDVAVPATIATWELGLGESQVLALAHAIPASEVALDDLAARRCALAHGILVVGTLGLLLRAKRHRLIPAARPLLKQLLDSGMYLEEELVANALAQVRE
jgi:predicted nucleic acid-binding protein